MPKLRTALMFMAGNFVGREYHARLAEAGRAPDLVVTVGAIKPESVEWEVRRTGGKWNPPDIPADVTVHHFDKMSDPALWDFLGRQDIDIAIQAGIGILKPHMLTMPRIGFLNVHPGNLPMYRGNACPEWALYNGDAIWASAHLIDEGIDTGPLVVKREMPIEPDWDYTDIRSRIYAHCARVLIEALERFEAWDGVGLEAVARKQDEAGAFYHPQIPAEKLAELQARLARQPVE